MGIDNLYHELGWSYIQLELRKYVVLLPLTEATPWAM